MLKRNFYIKILLLFMLCCQKPLLNNNLMTGNWKWIKSTGGMTGSDIQTPELYGSLSLIIYDHAFYALKTKEAISDKMHYELKQLTDMLTGEHANGILFYDKNMRPLIPQLITLKHDTLILKENITDSYTHYYIKVS